MGRLIALLKYALVITALSSTTAYAYNQLFDWSTAGWSPDGTGSLPRVYTDVGGRGVDIVVDIAPTDRFIDTTPQVDPDNGLENHVDFNDTAESTTFTFSFYQTGTTIPVGVYISNLTTKDLDSYTGTSNFQDAITFSAIPLGGGTAVAPDQIQLYANTILLKQGADTVYADISQGALGVTDVEGWATARYDSQLIQSFSVQYHSGPDISGTLTRQFMWISNFTFSDVVTYSYTSTECSPTFTDISGTGSLIISADDGEADVTLPFPFRFYDSQSTVMTVGDNGGIIFGATGANLAYDNLPLPTNDPAPAILPFWDDLNSGQNKAGVYVQTLGTAPNRQFIVQWNNIPHYSNTGRATFQAILFEGSNNIFFVYPDVNFGDSRYDDGASATIGINNGGSEAQQYSYNSASLNGIGGICYYYPTDYGDAPATYGDPSHSIDPDLYIGTADDASDPEDGTQYSTDANGDNMNGTDDENGVTFRSPAGTNQSIFADVVVNNSTGSPATVCAWLDIPTGGVVDGSFDATDAADSPCQTVSSSTTVTFQWSNLPGDQSYTTYARFRVSTESLTAANATGAALNGEVEDYRIDFDFTPTAVTIGKVELAASRVANFLAGLAVEQMDPAALLSLLQAWDPESAAALAGETRDKILAALENYLDPDGDGQVAVLSWDTLEERGTIGFYVDRRKNNGAWQRINNDMLPGLINAPMGGEYQLADPEVRSGGMYQYQLIEQEARGTTRTYGPYTVELP